MKSLFKILIITMLGLSVVGCELLDLKRWERARQKAAERGRTCYEYSSGLYIVKILNKIINFSYILMN